MKLKDMTTDQAADALVKIAEPAAQIMEDENAIKLFEQMASMQNATLPVQLGFLVRNGLPMLLQKHRNATYTVLSVMTGKSVKEIGGQKIGDTVEDIKNSVDADLLGFFTSAKAQRQNGETE